MVGVLDNVQEGIQFCFPVVGSSSKKGLAPEVMGLLAGVQLAKLVVSFVTESLALPEEMLTVGLIGCVAPSTSAWADRYSHLIEKRSPG